MARLLIDERIVEDLTIRHRFGALWPLAIGVLVSLGLSAAALVHSWHREPVVAPVVVNLPELPMPAIEVKVPDAAPPAIHVEPATVQLNLPERVEKPAPADPWEGWVKGSGHCYQHWYWMWCEIWRQ